MIAELAAAVSLHCTFTESGRTEQHQGRVYVDYDLGYAFFDMDHPRLGRTEVSVLVTTTSIDAIEGFFTGFNEIREARIDRTTGELRISTRAISPEIHYYRGTCAPGEPITPPQPPKARF